MARAIIHFHSHSSNQNTQTHARTQSTASNLCASYTRVKLKQYQTIHTNYMLPHCTTIQFNYQFHNFGGLCTHARMHARQQARTHARTHPHALSLSHSMTVLGRYHTIFSYQAFCLGHVMRRNKLLDFFSRCSIGAVSLTVVSLVCSCCSSFKVIEVHCSVCTSAGIFIISSGTAQFLLLFKKRDILMTELE